MWNFLCNRCLIQWEDTRWGAVEQIWVILDRWAAWVVPTSSLADTCCHQMGRNVGHFCNKICDFLCHHVPFDFCCGDSKVIQSTNESFGSYLIFWGFWSTYLIQFWVLLSILASCILPSHFPKAMLQQLLPKFLITSYLSIFWLLFTIPKTCSFQ